MRLSVEHRLTLLPPPHGRPLHLLRATPAHSHDQTVIHWRIDVGCDARLREGRDGFGNLTTLLYVDTAEAVELTVVGEVLTSHSDGVLHGVAETLPPALYRRAAPLAPADAATVARVRDEAGGDRLDRLHALNRLLAGEEEARDLARRFVAVARALGAPARHVTGYSAAGGGDCAPHGWAEAHVEGLGWVGFDPHAACSPEEEYVRVAAALDAAGAAMVAA